MRHVNVDVNGDVDMNVASLCVWLQICVLTWLFISS